MPLRCAAASASQISRAMRSFRARLMPISIALLSVTPSISSRTRKSPSSASIYSWMRQMFGWSRTRACGLRAETGRARRRSNGGRRGWPSMPQCGRAARRGAIHLTHAARPRTPVTRRCPMRAPIMRSGLTSRSNDGTPIRPMRGSPEPLLVLLREIVDSCAHGSPLQSPRLQFLIGPFLLSTHHPQPERESRKRLVAIWLFLWPVFVFDQFCFDCDQKALLRGGEPVRLTPRAFRLLELLLCQRPKAVSKRELLDQVWSGDIVEEANLKTLVLEIRTALEERGGRAEVDPHGISATATPSRARWRRRHGRKRGRSCRCDAKPARCCCRWADTSSDAAPIAPSRSTSPRCRASTPAWRSLRDALRIGTCTARTARSSTATESAELPNSSTAPRSSSGKCR